jgi:hypothetical protein
MKDWVLNCKTTLMPGCMSLISIAALLRHPIGQVLKETREVNKKTVRKQASEFWKMAWKRIAQDVTEDFERKLYDLRN